MKREIEIFYLEMTYPDELRPARPLDVDFPIRQARIPCPELNRFLYTAVGGDWFWIDRLSWTYEQWLTWLSRSEVETWIGYLEGTPAGYFELEKQAEGNVELSYFGLLPQFLGRRLGGALLTAAVERAWEMGASRVWVNTCTLDGPAALPGYQARGFQIFKRERLVKEFPEETPGPWPGAGAWDRRIEADVRAGKLDFLREEGLREFQSRSRPQPRPGINARATQKKPDESGSKS